MSTIEEVKITGWSHKGLRIPDYEIDLEDPNSRRNFSLILQLSGEGKTTTLHLLRYCFYDFLKDIENKKEREEIFDSIKSLENTINKGQFVLKLKLNNEINYKIHLEFDFKNYELKYFTSAGDGAGKDPGLNLPDSLKYHLKPEFIKKSFFDLELVNELFDEQEKETDKTISNLCKIYFLDTISKSFDYYKEQREENVEDPNISESDVRGKKLKREKIQQQIKNIEKKAAEMSTKRKSLKSEYNKLDNEEKKIREDKKEIDRILTDAENNLKEKEDELEKTFSEAYDFLKNPMSLDQRLFDELKVFEDNLTKKSIPKSVGEAFFKDLVASDECLCGEQMTEARIKKINISKTKYLTDETYTVLNPIKAVIIESKKIPNDLINKSFGELIKKEANLRRAKNKLIDVRKNFDNERLVEIVEIKTEIKNELKPLNEFLEDTYKKPYNKGDTPDEESKKSLEKQLEKIEDEISQGTNTVDLSNKTKIVKKWIREIKKESLEEISKKLVDDINKEVPRVMPYEPIYVKSIKNKIELEGRTGAAQGQKARITYLFLVTLLNRPNLKFPFIVDSPVTAMDDVSREEIAKTLSKELKSQYIGFLLPPERPNFANTLDEELKKNINLIVAFSKNKNTQNLIDQARNYDTVDINKFENGVVAYDRDFFYSFSGTYSNDEKEEE